MAPAGGTQLAEEQSIPTAHSLTVKLDYVPPLPKTQECCNIIPCWLLKPDISIRSTEPLNQLLRSMSSSFCISLFFVKTCAPMPFYWIFSIFQVGGGIAYMLL